MPPGVYPRKPPHRHGEAHGTTEYRGMKLSLYGGFSLKRATASYGWAVAIALSLAAVLFVTLAGPEVTDVTPLRDDRTVRQVPATGVEGYVGTAAFCEDSRTKVALSITPGVGAYFSMTRTVNGIPELIQVTVPFAAALPPVGTHWANSNVGQTSQPAILDEATLKCAEKKAVPLR